MGLLYDVTYPYSRDLDSEVGERYLDLLARDAKNNGAVACCVNGERQTLQLVKGEWVEIDRHGKPIRCD